MANRQRSQTMMNNNSENKQNSEDSNDAMAPITPQRSSSWKLLMEPPGGENETHSTGGVTG